MLNKPTQLYAAIVITIFFLGACTSYKPFFAKSEKDWQKANNPDSLKLDYTVFLIGDVGKPSLKEQEPTLKLMESQMYKTDTLVKDSRDTVIQKLSSPKDAVIFMGDNIYEYGMPEPGAVDRKLKEQYITEQMKVVKDFKGKRIFIPGNHDWRKSRPGGLATLKREEDFIENYLDSTDVFLPSNGCAGPVEVQMNGNLVIIAIDSEWWLTKFSRSDRYEQGCSVETDDQLIARIKDILLRSKGKNIVFTEHHPLFSNGKHGGYFTLIDYFFPLTLVRDNLYIPLPILGSVYPLLRQYGLSREDISNKKYQELKNRLLTLFADQKNLVIASGHEHALQLTKYKNIYQVISGAGSKKSALTTGNGALFGHGTKGFARLNYYKNGQCWVEFWEPIGDGSKGKLVYRSPLYSLPVSKKDIIAEKEINYSDSVKVMAVGEQYKASSFKKAIFGEHYRSVWASPIEIPYLDLTKFAGGLTPLQLGGGHQTKSLRLEGKDKIQYQFRTIDKDPSSLLPEGLRLTFADQIAQDQISSAHPFGALIVPDLASAIGVYHTNPQVVYMPYSRLLGPYLQDIGGRAGIIEIRADEDLSQFKDFGYTKNAVGTETMYDKLKEDNDNSVDQKSFLKARLFDMLIGDWDRHEDQWRWAEFNKKGKGILFRPIPRDRDQVFTKFDGIIPSLIKSILPDIQNFDYHIKSPADLSIAARNLDRNLLNQLSYQDWMAVTDSMKVRLTDAVIEKSVKKIPPTAYDLTGKEIIAKLKSRRDELTKTADEYYKVLAKEVTVSGSDKYEYVEINREKDSTNVKMYKTKKDGEIDKIIYSRVFANDLTNELNFYLLGNEDSLVVKGSSTRPIKIRVVGGKDKDYLADEAGNGRTIFYDTPGTKTKDGANTKIVLSKGDWVNEYLPNDFIYDKRGLSPNIDYKNSGDGLLLGLSYNVKHYGFRKDPYSFEQKVSVLHSIKTAALLAKYKGTFYSLFAHKYDLVLAAKYDGSAFDYNYYGLGNSTPNVGDDVNFYRVKSTSISTNVYLQYHITDDVKFGIGPGYDYMKILDRSEANYLGSRNITNIDPEKFVTLKSYLNLAFVDSKVNPKTGFKWDNEVGFYSEINGKKDQHLRLSSIATIYGTPNISFPVTFALRIGAQTNIGDYKFYQANTIGNNTYLRGFRSQRFSGKTAYFANSEFRFKVSSFRNYIFTGDFGVYTFYDIAKIRSNQLESKDWHQGYGPGIWINFYDKILLSLGYGFSNESRVFSFSTGFRF